MTAADLYEIYRQPGESLRSTAQKAREQFGISLTYETVRTRLIEAGYPLKRVGKPEEGDPMPTVAVRVEPDLRDWVVSQPEGEAETVRAALRLYKARSRGKLPPSEKSGEARETVCARVEPEIRRWLQSLPGLEADHLRLALRRYRQAAGKSKQL